MFFHYEIPFPRLFVWDIVRICQFCAHLITLLFPVLFNPNVFMWQRDTSHTVFFWSLLFLIHSGIVFSFGAYRYSIACY